MFSAIAVILIQLSSGLADSAADDTAVDLRVVPLRFEGCGKSLSLTFSIENAAASVRTFAVVPSDDPSAWKGDYGVAIAELVAASAASCGTDHGGACIREREAVALAPQGRRTWTMSILSFGRVKRHTVPASFTVKVRESEAELVSLRWEGKFETVALPRSCWRSVAVQQGVATDGALPRRRTPRPLGGRR